MNQDRSIDDDADVTLPPEKITKADDRLKNDPATPSNLLGEYELIEELARGGMGVVYKARHRKLNRDVALKMILGGKFSSEAEVQRFYIEAEAAAKLDHPGIVPIFEIGTAEGQPFFAMKLIDGGSLSQRISSFQGNIRKSVEFVAKVAHAIHHAHQRGILHRDIKPANILLDEDENPVITDLGLAKSTANESNLTQTGVIIGTPSYMPPEQAQSNQSLTTSADIYSIGAILYELLTSQPPHQGSSAFATVMKVINDDVRPPRELNHEVSRDLELICMKCLSKNQEDRYTSAADLADDLERWAEGKPVSVRPMSVFSRVSQWVGQNKTIFYAALVLLVSLLLTVPLALSILGSLDDPAELYVGDDADPIPFLYSFTNIPTWISITSLISVLIVSPMLGMLVATISRPKSISNAIYHGGVVALTTSALLYILLGGLMHSVAAQGITNSAVRTLAEGVWIEADPNSDIESVRKELLESYPKLDEVPDNGKVNFVANRIFADGVAGSLIGILVMGIVVSLWAFQIIVGTVIAYVMTRRHRRWWIRWPRYGAAWLSVMITISIYFSAIGNGMFNRVNFSELPSSNQIFILVLPPMFTFLILFRWSRLWKGRKDIQQS